VTAWAGLTIPKMHLHYREKLNILYAGTSIFNGVHIQDGDSIKTYLWVEESCHPEGVRSSI
jgi:hypothetical protein